MVIMEYDRDIGGICHLRCDCCGAESAKTPNRAGGRDALNFARPEGWNQWHENQDLCPICVRNKISQDILWEFCKAECFLTESEYHVSYSQADINEMFPDYYRLKKRYRDKRIQNAIDKNMDTSKPDKTCTACNDTIDYSRVESVIRSGRFSRDDLMGLSSYLISIARELSPGYALLAIMIQSFCCPVFSVMVAKIYIAKEHVKCT